MQTQSSNLEALPFEIKESKLTKAQKKVLNSLFSMNTTDYAKENGEFYISNAELAKHAQVDNKTLIDTISLFKTYDFIETVRGSRIKGQSKGQASTYKLNVGNIIAWCKGHNQNRHSIRKKSKKESSVGGKVEEMPDNSTNTIIDTLLADNKLLHQEINGLRYLIEDRFNTLLDKLDKGGMQMGGMIEIQKHSTTDTDTDTEIEKENKTVYNRIDHNEEFNIIELGEENDGLIGIETHTNENVSAQNIYHTNAESEGNTTQGTVESHSIIPHYNETVYSKNNERFNEIYERVREYREQWKRNHKYEEDIAILGCLQSAVEMYHKREITDKQIYGFYRYLLGYFKMRAKYNQKLIDTNATIKTWFSEALSGYFNFNLNAEEYRQDILDPLVKQSTVQYNQHTISIDQYEAFRAEISSLYSMKYDFKGIPISEQYKVLLQEIYPEFTTTIYNGKDNKKPYKAAETHSEPQDNKYTNPTDKVSSEGLDETSNAIVQNAIKIITDCARNCEKANTGTPLQNAIDVTEILKPLKGAYSRIPSIQALDCIHKTYICNLFQRLENSCKYDLNTVNCLRSNFEYEYNIYRDLLSKNQPSTLIQNTDTLSDIQIYEYLTPCEIEASISIINDANKVIEEADINAEFQDFIKEIDQKIYKIENSPTIISIELEEKFEDIKEKWKNSKQLWNNKTSTMKKTR